MLGWCKRRMSNDNEGCSLAVPVVADQGVSAAQPRAKRPRLARNAHLEALHDVQMELQLLDEQCAEEQIRIQHRYDQTRRPHFVRRRKLINEIRGFWKAALCSHTQQLVHPAETDALEYLKSIDLLDNLDDKGSFEVRASFIPNEIFVENVLVKKVTFNESCEEVIQAGKLSAKGAHGREVLAQISSAQKSVLGWFLSSQAKKPHDYDDLGDVLRRDLWQDPVPYFMAHQITKKASLRAQASHPRPAHDSMAPAEANSCV